MQQTGSDTPIDGAAGRPGNPRRDAWLMFAGRGTRDAARTMMAVLIGIFLVEGLGFSQSELGLLLGISLAGGLLLSFGLMLTGNRLSRRWSFVAVALVTSLAGLDIDSLAPVFASRPAVVLLGTGERQQFPDARIFGLFGERGIGLEVMDNGALCRTFNILVAEDRAVTAAIIIDT